jgi:hypothetical protein
MNFNNFPSFVVRLFSSSNIEYFETSIKAIKRSDNHILYCNCGNEQHFNSSLVRELFLNSIELVENFNSLQSIQCNKCGKIYDKSEKLILMEPDIPIKYLVDYNLEFIKEDSYILNKEKHISFYSSKEKKLFNLKEKDIFKLDLKNNKFNLKINTPFDELNKENNFLRDNFLRDYNSNFINLEEIEDVKPSSNLDLTNVRNLDDFFNFDSFTKYYGFEEISKVLDLLKVKLKDLDKFESVYFVDFIKKKHKLIKDKDNSGEILYFKEVESGFGDGKIIKKNLNTGDYLFNSLNSFKLIVSILSFESASSIIHTKGYNFFKQWLDSIYVLSPSIYNKHNATSPNSIMEVSLNYNKEGKRRVVKSSSNTFYNFCQQKKDLKVSNTIYNSISLIDGLGVLNDCNRSGLLSKVNLEFLFQNYKSNRVYSLLKKVIKSLSNNEKNLVFRNIKHILDANIDLERNDFITIYRDTIRMIEILEVKEKVIFKCKNFKELKGLHDDYTVRCNAIKDAKKVEDYKNSVSKFLYLNSKIDDVNFEVVESLERLNIEGLEMNHCIYTYLDRICQKSYLAINVTHQITNERATAGFLVKGKNIYLEQIKGYFNSRATKELIEKTLEFCEVNEISIEEVHNSDIIPNKERQRLMKGQITEEELMEIRKKNKKN